LNKGHAYDKWIPCFAHSASAEPLAGGIECSAIKYLAMRWQRRYDSTRMSEPQAKSIVPKLIATIVVSPFIAYVVVIVVPNITRATYSRSSNACVNNLRQIAGAKEQWALRTGSTQMTSQPAQTSLVIATATSFQCVPQAALT
jgi:hypothetical protein